MHTLFTQHVYTLLHPRPSLGYIEEEGDQSAAANYPTTVYLSHLEPTGFARRSRESDLPARAILRL